LAPEILSVYSLKMFIAALDGHLAQIEKLGLRVLIDTGDPHIKDSTFHLRRPFGSGEYFVT
jgi:hypothetical protein